LKLAIENYVVGKVEDKYFNQFWLKAHFVTDLIKRVEEKQKTVRLEQFTVDTIITMLKEEIES
jgi:hypothetical protein